MTVLSTAPKGRGVLLLTIAAVAWGTGGAVAVVLAGRYGLGPVAVTFWRFVVAAAAVVALRASRPGARVSETRRGAALSGAGLAVSQAAYFGAVGQAGLAVGTLVTIGASPVLIALGARFLLGEPTGRARIAVLCAAVGGLALLAGRPGESGPDPVLGIGLAMVSAVAYSAVVLYARRSRGGGAGPVTFAAGSLLLAPFALAEGLLPTAGTAAAALGWLLYLGIVPTALAYRWFFAGLVTVPATTAAVIALLEPVAASFIALALLGERIDAVGWTGAGVLLAALAALAAAETRGG